jgi:hypothetical protein
MSITDFSLRLYRKTLKRFRSAHMATHWLMTHGVIPLLEKSTSFRTMPDDPFGFGWSCSPTGMKVKPSLTWTSWPVPA